MYRELMKAFLGKVQWDIFRHKYRVDRYLFMPHKQEEYNDYTLRYLTAYLEKEKARSACLVTYDQAIFSRVKQTNWSEPYQIQVVLKRRSWIRRIIQFYALYEFSSQVKIISLTEPYDTCGENLLGVHGVTKKELCCYDILGFSQIPDEQGEQS